MAWARKEAGQWVELFGAIVTGAGDAAITRPPGWLEAATPEDLAAAGIFVIAEAGPAPTDAQVIGTAITGGDSPVRVWTTVPFDLAALRAQMINKVNGEAGAFRRRFITDISGQQATYLAKEAEALAWTAEGDPADFPYLAAEAGATGQVIGEIAALVLATAALWRGLDPQIEGLRRGAIVAIGAAANAAAIGAAAAIDWDALSG